MTRLANLLGAAAVALTDAQLAAMAAAGGLSPSAAATVLTLGQSGPLTLSDLAAIVGLSHSAMVRLTDGLLRDGLVARGPGRDRREVALRLTETGLALQDRLRAARASVLTDITATLPAPEAAALEATLCHLLTALTHDRRGADHLCRFCDEGACGGDACPVERRAVALAPP